MKHTIFLCFFLMSCSPDIATIEQSSERISLLLHQTDSIRQRSNEIYKNIEQIKNSRAVDSVTIGTDVYISESSDERRQVRKEIKALRDSFALSSKRTQAIEKEQQLIKERLDRIEKEIKRRRALQ